MAKIFSMLMNDDRLDFPTEMHTFEQLFNQEILYRDGRREECHELAVRGRP